ncbi:hypothetical protein V6U77_17035 [Micromonospora sp. CPCC 205546]|uniref:hypothetical protein n=1 Tax=Micromonospora sp. CPCC 205546 TaxID=3122397 RepID=UPI002FEF84C5
MIRKAFVVRSPSGAVVAYAYAYADRRRAEQHVYQQRHAVECGINRLLTKTY